MPRGQRLSNAEKLTNLQNKIDSYKSQIDSLEKQKDTIQKQMTTEAVSELASFIERKHMSVTDVKRIINSSVRTSNKTAEVRA